MPPTIYDYVKEKESQFQTDEVQIADNWFWNFRNHVQLIFQLKNSIFSTGTNNWLRAFKNIMEPMLNLSYWTEEIEVKDIILYTEEEDNRILTFLLKKYHQEVYVREHNIKEMLDNLTESDIDYGGVLVQKGVDMPEVLALNSVAFCDQTDMLGTPLAFRHFFSPEKLREMGQYGWGNEKNGATISLNDLCVLANDTKKSATLSQKQNKVTGKTIEVYIVRGNLPYAYLNDDNDMDTYCNQLQIIAYYTKKDSTKQGVTLYRKEEDEGNLKFFTSQKVYQRALGRGVGETLLHPQIWSNFLTIHKTNMLESASKVPLYTDDSSYNVKNKIQDMENLEITTIEDGKKIYQVPTAAPANLNMLNTAIDEWFVQAQAATASEDPIAGKEAPSGTTFKGQERSVIQNQGTHDRRVGKRAKFIEEIYRDYIIPDMTKEILKGTQFLASLSADELAWLSDAVVTNVVNKYVIDSIINGTYINSEQQDQITAQLKQQFKKKGNKHMLEILKGEFKDVKIKIGIDVANKNRDVGGMVNNLQAMMQMIIANPYIIKSPPIQKLFNEIVEMMGLSPIDLSELNVPPIPARRITEQIAYKDLATPPNDIQKEFLALAGIQNLEEFGPTLPGQADPASLTPQK